MALDYSKLTDEQLQAIADKDYSKLPDDVLAHLADEHDAAQKEGTDLSPEALAARNSPVTAGATGAIVGTGAAATKKGIDVAEAINNLTKGQPTNTPTGEWQSPGAKWDAKTGYGAGTGETVEERVSAAAERQAPLGRGKVSSRIKGPASPDEILAVAAEKEKEALERARILAQEKLKHEAEQAAIAAEKRYHLPNAAGKMLPVAGATAAYNVQDAINQAKQGDVGQAVISGAGALGSAAPFIKRLPPKARAIGFGASLVAPLVNKAIDTVQGQAAGGSVEHFESGGLAIAKKLFTPVATKIVKASEALGPHEGKWLNVTQSDRMRSTMGDLGGPGFSKFQLEHPDYAEAQAAWGVGKKPTASGIVNVNKRFPEGQAIWTPMIGGETQHHSNQHVYDALADEFKRQASMGNLPKELQERMNTRLANAPATKGMFPAEFDIGNPEHLSQYGDTFNRRGALSTVMSGEGVGGTKGRIIDYPGIMQEMTDPMTVGAPTHALGTRLFTLNNEVEHRPDLHSAFPYILKGEDQGVAFAPVPKELGIQDFINQFKEFKGREPGYYDLVRTTPSQQITDKYLRTLEEAGHAEGGAIQNFETGGIALAKAALKMAKPAVNRLEMGYKNVTKRIPELQESAKRILEGTGSREEHEALVNTHKPVMPYSFVPQPATREEAVNALTSDKKDLYGVPSQTLEAGHPVGLRLDIPSYTNHGVWVPTVHEQASGFGAGKSIGHESVASVLNPMFGMSEKAAASIASGKPKGTIATIKGEWNPVDQEQAVASAQEYLNHPDWRQVGMDPERHSYFYDRETMEPITHAEEALQIGPLVLAKKPVYGNKEEFKYAKGGKTKKKKK